MEAPVLWVTCVFAMLAGGVYLLVRGLRGRRRGTEPQCARCGYLLLYLESDRCPECGTVISAAGMVLGQRRPMWGRIALGSLLVAVGCLSLVEPVRQAVEAIPWYHYKPTCYVLDDLDGSVTYSRAMKELQRRQAAGFRPWIHQKLIEKGLDEQANPNGNRRELLEYVGNACLRGQLSEQQKQRFVDQACAATITIRPVVGEGDRVPFWFWNSPRHLRGDGQGEFWMRRDDRARRIDGKTVEKAAGVGCNWTQGGGISAWHIPEAVGIHTLEVQTHCTLWYGVPYEQDRSRLIGTSVATGRASYEVRAKESAPRIELLHSEQMQREVEAAIHLRPCRQEKDGYLVGWFAIASPPCDLAFDVFAETGGIETEVGVMVCAKGASADAGILERLTRLPPRINIILRPSGERAKMTVYQTAIYGREIVFRDVEVKQEGNQAAATLGGDVAQQRQDLHRDEAEHARKKRNVQDAILNCGVSSLLKDTLQQLEAVERELARRRCDLDALRRRELVIPASASELRRLFEQGFASLAFESRECGDLLRRLVPEVHVYLIRLCDSDRLCLGPGRL